MQGENSQFEIIRMDCTGNVQLIVLQRCVKFWGLFVCFVVVVVFFVWLVFLPSEKAVFFCICHLSPVSEFSLRWLPGLYIISACKLFSCF